MLTDVFFRRYAGFHLKDEFAPSDAAFLVQGHRLLVEQVFPYYLDGKKVDWSAKALKEVHDTLSMEIGVHELSQKFYSYKNDFGHQITGSWEYDYIIKEYLCAPFQDNFDVSSFIIRRVSLLELAFKLRESQVSRENQSFKARSILATALDGGRSQQRNAHILGDLADWAKLGNDQLNNSFNNNVKELNARFLQAGYPFHYHNGFVQIAHDKLLLSLVEKPFWELVAAPLWANVDTDMKEAIDRRDNNGRDPAFYGAKALESTIKIISDQKGVTTGKEKGAHNYIDNLLSSRANRFIAQWEADALKALFKDNRNPFGHGPGSAPMPQLNAQQTDWVIENCMSWIKSLVRRFCQP